MKITRFCPNILSPKAADIIEVFEALGFERRHKKEGIGQNDVSSVTMKDANGFNVIVTQVDSLPQDVTTVQMNVRDLDEALEFLESKGFKNAQGDRVTDTGTSVATMMVSPSGFPISISEHIRK